MLITFSSASSSWGRGELEEEDSAAVTLESVGLESVVVR